METDDCVLQYRKKCERNRTRVCSGHIKVSLIFPVEGKEGKEGKDSAPLHRRVVQGGRVHEAPERGRMRERMMSMRDSPVARE